MSIVCAYTETIEIQLAMVRQREYKHQRGHKVSHLVQSNGAIMYPVPDNKAW